MVRIGSSCLPATDFPAAIWIDPGDRGRVTGRGDGNRVAGFKQPFANGFCGRRTQLEHGGITSGVSR